MLGLWIGVEGLFIINLGRISIKGVGGEEVVYYDVVSLEG